MWTVGEESRMNWEVSTDTYTLGCVCSVLQSCATLWDAMDCSPPASSVQGMLQALLQGIFLTQGSDLIPCVSCIAGRFFTH